MFKRNKPLLQTLLQAKFYLQSNKACRIPIRRSALAASAFYTLLLLTLYKVLRVTPAFINYLYTLSVLILIVWPLLAMYISRQQASLSTLLAKGLTNKQLSHLDAARQVSDQRGAVWQFTFLRIIGGIGVFNLQKPGYFGWLVSKRFAYLHGRWAEVRHFLLPALMIERHNFQQTTAKLQSLLLQNPRRIALITHIDYLFRIVGILVGPINMLCLLVGVVLGHYFATDLPKDSLFFIGNFHFSWIPVYGLLAIELILLGIAYIILTMLQTCCASIAYLALFHPHTLSDKYRKAAQQWLATLNIT